MLSLIQKNLSLKLLLSLVIILVLSFLGLYVSIVQGQNSLLGEMRAGVSNALEKSGEEARENFSKLESHVERLLSAMEEKASGSLSEATRKALSAEEERIEKGMEALLLTNANALASILNIVAPGYIMAERKTI